ncbi:MAG: hypothetical protein K5776_03690 [Lachnospiraceae bacterium]|nr:hypothetical protein [Lachnospiraceae bacterium]
MGLFSKIKEKINKKEEKAYMDDYRAGKITWDEAMNKLCGEIYDAMVSHSKAHQFNKWGLYRHVNYDIPDASKDIDMYIKAKETGILERPDGSVEKNEKDVALSMRCIEEIIKGYDSIETKININKNHACIVCLSGFSYMTLYFELLRDHNHEEFSYPKLYDRIIKSRENGYATRYGASKFYDCGRYTAKKPFIYDAYDSYDVSVYDKFDVANTKLGRGSELDDERALHDAITFRYCMGIGEIMMSAYKESQRPDFDGTFDRIINDHGFILDQNGELLEEDIYAQWKPIDDKGILGSEYIAEAAKHYDEEYSKMIQQHTKAMRERMSNTAKKTTWINHNKG